MMVNFLVKYHILELTQKLNGKAGEFVKREKLEDMEATIEKLKKDNASFKKINEGSVYKF